MQYESAKELRINEQMWGEQQSMSKIVRLNVKIPKNLEKLAIVEALYFLDLENSEACNFWT